MQQLEKLIFTAGGWHEWGLKRDLTTVSQENHYPNSSSGCARGEEKLPKLP